MPNPPPLPNGASNGWWGRNGKWFSVLLSVASVGLIVGFFVLVRGVRSSAAYRARMANNLGANSGKGPGSDLQKTLELYRQEAARGDAVAAYDLGVMYDEGNLVAQDHAVANTWYRKSAEQGYPSAMINLGYNLAKGEGTAVDSVEAMKWFGVARVFILQEKDSPLTPLIHETYDVLKDRLPEAEFVEESMRTQAWLDAGHTRYPEH